ncbi:MAG TPA: hypothetical protein PKD55_06855 [Bellilinea sp.]|nr:hypothetical protein [Bellilinea sp.]
MTDFGWDSIRKYRFEVAALVLISSFYLIGAGVPFYRGDQINSARLINGLIVILATTIAAFFLSAYFKVLRELATIDPQKEKPGGRLLLGITWLVIAVLFFILGRNSDGGFHELIFVLALMFVFFYSVTPFHMARSKYKVLVEAAFVSLVVPTYGFAAQTSDGLKQFAWIILPLFLLFLASYLALSMRTYSTMPSRDITNPVNALGWKTAMSLHNYLILVAFVLIAISRVIGLSWSLVWPRLLVLPIGVLEIVEMLRIAEGAPVRWTYMNSLAITLTGFSVYFLLFTLWLG